MMPDAHSQHMRELEYENMRGEIASLSARIVELEGALRQIATGEPTMAFVRKIAKAALSSPHPRGSEMTMDRETIQTLLDLLNPLYGELDRQTYDQRVQENFDATSDAEYNVDITAQMERDLSQAVAILESRLRELSAHPNTTALLDVVKAAEVQSGFHNKALKQVGVDGCDCQLCVALSRYRSSHPTGEGQEVRDDARGSASVYVASRVKHASMWQALRARGANIISTWIDEAGEGETEDFSILWERIRDEVASAAKLVLYVEPEDFPLKGALVEVGMALAFNRSVIVCAPGVVVEGRTMRPLGSWLHDDKVTRVDNIRAAMQLALPATPATGLPTDRQGQGK